MGIEWTRSQQNPIAPPAFEAVVGDLTLLAYRNDRIGAWCAQVMKPTDYPSVEVTIAGRVCDENATLEEAQALAVRLARTWIAAQAAALEERPALKLWYLRRLAADPRWGCSDHVAELLAELDALRVKVERFEQFLLGHELEDTMIRQGSFRGTTTTVTQVIDYGRELGLWEAE